jgi:sugar phosphate isomerase/epimerase
MDIKLACADFSFPLLSHDAAIKLVGLMGFTGVDLGMFEGRSHLMPSTEFGDIPRRAREVKKKLGDAGLVAADVFLQMAPDFVPYAVNHPESERREKAREWFLKTLAYANAVGCSHVTTLPGVTFESEPRAESLRRSAEELAWRLGEAKKAGIVFSVEAHVGSLVPSPEDALELVGMTPGLTLTLDYTHFTRAGMPDSRVAPMVKHASHFHARGACPGRLQTLFKRNTIDYPGVLKEMTTVGYSGWVGVEYVWIDWEGCNECDNVSETVQMRDLLVKSARELGSGV